MTTKEYVKTAQKARALLLESYVEFADGDDHLKACEKLWQAAAHAITAVAQQRGWECDDPGIAERHHKPLGRGTG